MLLQPKQPTQTSDRSTESSAIFDKLYNPVKLMSNFEQQQPNQHTDYLRRYEVCQRNLAADILLMLLGTESTTFRFKQEEGFSVAGIVELSHLTPLALENMLGTFTQFANRIKYIENKLDILAIRPSLLLSNLVFSIKQWLKDLKQLFSEALSVVRFQSGGADRSHLHLTRSTIDPSRPMTLLVLRELISDQNDTMSIVLGLVNRCFMNRLNQQNNNYSAFILNTFWELIDRLQHQFIHTPKAKTMLSMLESPLAKYLQFIRGWLSGRQLNDPYNEFYIQFKPNPNSASEVEQYGIRGARNSMIPAFLKDVSNEIFLTGRFIRTLYCFVKEPDRQKISEQLDIDGKFARLQQTIKGDGQEVRSKQYQGFFKKMKRVSVSDRLSKEHSQIEYQYTGGRQQPLPYDMDGPSNSAFLLCRLIVPHDNPQGDTANQCVLPNAPTRKFISDYSIQFELSLNQTLQEIKSKCEKYFCFIGSPVEEFSVIREKVDTHTELIKRFLLAGQGDFIQELLQSVSDELDKSVALISSNVLRTGIDNAIKNSNAHYLSPEILKSVGWRFIVNDMSYTGWDVFSLDCRMEYPLCLVFPQSIMDRYSVIFNFLWKLKRVELMVKRLWMDNYGLNRLSRLRKVPQKYYGFRSAVNHFATSVLSEILFKIDIEWSRFMDAKNKLHNFFEFLTLHNNFVSKLEQITFISLKDKSVIARLGALTQVVVRFKNLNLYLENEDYEQLLSKQKYNEMLRLQAEFNALMREFVRADSGLAVQAIDLNSYYDKP